MAEIALPPSEVPKTLTFLSSSLPNLTPYPADDTCFPRLKVCTGKVSAEDHAAGGVDREGERRSSHSSWHFCPSPASPGPVVLSGNEARRTEGLVK